jgi:hypothetical protein
MVPTAELDVVARGEILSCPKLNPRPEHIAKFVYWVRFQGLVAASLKMPFFGVVAPWSLVEVYRRFRETYCLNYRGDAGGSKNL